MTRALTIWLDAVRDAIGLPLAAVLLFGGAAAIGSLWYWFPRWIPRRAPRLRPILAWFRRRRWPSWLRWPRWRRAGLAGRLRRWRLSWRRPDWARLLVWFRGLLRRRRKIKTEDPDAVLPEPAPSGPPVPEDLASLADRLAAQGRYAEAVRERLRAMVSELVARGLIGHRPDWTVTELAAAAGAAHPAVRPPLDAAGQTFSEIWYAQRPAAQEHDTRMRAHLAQLRHMLEAAT